jgi:hypothetical protein
MDVAKMDDAKSELSQVSDTATTRMVEGLRALMHDRKSAEAAEHASKTWEDILAAGATSIADIDKLVGELQIAREYLQSEGERVRQVNARHAHLARTASASVKIISESLGKWRNSETIGPALPRAPTLAPVDDD